MKALLLTLICALAATSLYAQSVNDLVFITEEYPPFNFSVEGKEQGIATDMLLEILKRVGARQTREDIGSFPWARGYNVALHTKNVLLYSTTRTAAREKQFKWVGPIIRSEIVLYARMDRHLSLDNIDEIDRQQLRVGTVLNDVGEQILLELGVERNRISRYNKGIHLAEMLQKGRIDLLAYGKLATLWNFKSLGYQPKDYEVVYSLKPADYYYALNIKTDDRVVSELQTALDQLKASGTLDRIVKSYLGQTPPQIKPGHLSATP